MVGCRIDSDGSSVRIPMGAFRTGTVLLPLAGLLASGVCCVSAARAGIRCALEIVPILFATDIPLPHEVANQIVK